MRIVVKRSLIYPMTAESPKVSNQTAPQLNLYSPLYSSDVENEISAFSVLKRGLLFAELSKIAYLMPSETKHAA